MSSSQSAPKSTKNKVNNLLARFEEITNNPEDFVSTNVHKSEIFTKLVKLLYAQIRDENQNSKAQFYRKNVLNRLSTGHLDDETIWNQIDLENKFFIQKFVSTFCEDQNADEMIDQQADFFQQSNDQLLSDSDNEEQSDDDDNDDDDEEHESEMDDDEINSDDSGDDRDEDEDEEKEEEIDLDTKAMIRKYNLNEEKKNRRR